MGFAGFDLLIGDSNNYAGQAKKAEKARQAAITQGTTSIDNAFGGFDENFYKKREQAYMDYAYPQLAQQYRDTNSSLQFGMSNRGLLNSTIANAARSRLIRTNAQARQGIADTALTQAQGLRKDVEGQKDTLLNQLYQSADPAGAQRGAIASASNFVIPSTYQPLANQFSSIAQQYYLNQVLNNYRTGYAGAQTPPTNEQYYGVNAGALPNV